MPKKIPADWKNLWVNEVLTRGQWGRCSGLDILRIQRVGHSPKIYAVWMPRKEDDPRPNAGRCASGKRLPEKFSTGEVDPRSAAKKAIEIYNEWEESNKDVVIQIEEDKEYSLSTYWELWFANQKKVQSHKRNYQKWIRDNKLKWNGTGYGIAHQPWSKKKVDEITAVDFRNYWNVLDARRTPDNDMSGTKKQQKTLIRKLLKEARTLHFHHLNIPDFPTISTNPKAVRSLTKHEWNCLRDTVIDLTDGHARRVKTPKQYWSLQWTQANRCNIRNFVDLWDALHLQWFFYLRAEDMPRIRFDWFTGDSLNKEYSCDLQITKGNRDKIKTRAFRPDHYDHMLTVMSRRRSGEYLILPYMNREDGEEGKPVIANLNFLLKKAVAVTNQTHGTLINPRISWTTLRHTAFRLTLQDLPELGNRTQLKDFATNGHTSVEMLEKNYLNEINLERTAAEAREKIPAGQIDGILNALNMTETEKRTALRNLIFTANEQIADEVKFQAFPGDDGDWNESDESPL